MEPWDGEGAIALPRVPGLRWSLSLAAGVQQAAGPMTVGLGPAQPIAFLEINAKESRPARIRGLRRQQASEEANKPTHDQTPP